MKQNNFLKFFTVVFLFVGAITLNAQTVKGKVTDTSGEALSFMNVVEKGTTNGTTTDENGEFSLNVEKMPTTISVSSLGFKTVEKSISDTSYITIVLEENNLSLDEVVLVGSRNKNRTVANTPVPVDVIDVAELLSAGPQVSVNDILNYVAPSFTSTSQTVSDGTDHIDPAALRGLGPDQVLVLVNGKRRHNTSLVNVNSTVGRGSVGTDMNTIPAFSIKRIEILKDGAAAQYGSDAIAGVINIVLKNSEGLEFQVNQGSNWGDQTNNQSGGMDGESFQFDVNYGIPLDDNGGFINFTGSLSTRAPSYRAGAEGFTGQIFDASNSVEWIGLNSGAGSDITQYSLSQIQTFAQGVTYFPFSLKNQINGANSIDELRGLLNFNTSEDELSTRGLTRQDFSMRVGQSRLRNGKFMANMEFKISDDFSFYAFGGISHRKGNAAGFYRRPAQSRAFTGLYPAGMLPEINSIVNDESIAVGIKGKQGDWDIDFSNTYGKNSFDFNIGNSSNASLQQASPLEVYAGGFSFTQNTTNLDLTKFYEDVMSGLNVAVGSEYRMEAYDITAGQEESWATYDVNGEIWNGDAATQVTDFFGRSRPGGIQVFPGFRPANERNATRNSYAFYGDLELDVNKNLFLSGAVRYENYSDFGSTFNWKLAGIVRLSDNVNLRAAASTGFRAPSLAQLNFNTISTNFISGVPYEVGTFSNDSQIAGALGIPQLKQEESFSASFGFTAKIPDANLSLTVDGFFTGIDDRVVLTGNFNIPDGIVTGAESARFFANAIDTETKGFDIVVSHKGAISDLSFSSDLALTFAYTQRVDDINSSSVLASQAGTYFGERESYFLETATPRFKANLGHMLQGDKWRLFVRNSFFGAVTNPDVTQEPSLNGSGANYHPIFGDKVLTDMSFGYDVSENMTLTIGSSNIFNVFPDASPSNLTSGNNFIYPRVTSQFGINGRTVFARLKFKL
ncbi:TonB-dependent receptor [bacterium]|nr:TonB-dependent receptor [Flavobacteriaceae bacterium]MDA9073417.1 TonB-dependent receptor [bacterium]MDA9254172.1 TonB-dependent receptor [Flavobacteriaceae bacterium]MDA9328145.1 TonB-dependent receptor [Flavobacteriaceae bacterium]MDB4025065.1 TonB-dependent receptor [Flavobacteriaceae bacterium]